jgi:hypothetical protein
VLLSWFATRQFVRGSSTEASLFSEAPSGVIAWNVNGQVLLLIVPNGDTSQAPQSLPGPYIFGSDSGKQVPFLNVADYNSDGLIDIGIEIRGEIVVFLNRGNGTVSLISAEERAKLAIQP